MKSIWQDHRDKMRGLGAFICLFIGLHVLHVLWGGSSNTMYLTGHGRRGRVGNNGPTIAYKAMGAPLRRRNNTHTHTHGVQGLAITTRC